MKTASQEQMISACRRPDVYEESIMSEGEAAAMRALHEMQRFSQEREIFL